MHLINPRLLDLLTAKGPSNREEFFCFSGLMIQSSLGGEYFREIVFFKEKNDLDVFKAEEYTFSAQVTGVAATIGTAAKADYQSGMVVFITTDKGLMVDASLGGQKFKYVPLASEEAKK